MESRRDVQSLDWKLWTLNQAIVDREPKVGIAIEIVDQDMCRLVGTTFSFEVKKKAAAFEFSVVA